MADPTPEDPVAMLTRLSQKPGVLGTLVLSSVTGAIVRTTGQLSNHSDKADRDLAAAADDAAESYRGSESQRGMQSAEEVARQVWSFVGAARAMIEKLEVDDEARLIRMRSKKKELLFACNPKYILVVIREAPPA